jgi:hypothetical protein
LTIGRTGATEHVFHFSSIVNSNMQKRRTNGHFEIYAKCYRSKSNAQLPNFEIIYEQ